MNADGTEDEEKFNKMINIDMEEQRKNIKTKVSYKQFIFVERRFQQEETDRRREKTQEKELIVIQIII